MGEKKSAVRTDLSPKEFASAVKVSNGETKGTKFKRIFSNLGEILSSLGLIPALNSNSKGHKHHGGAHHYSPNSFKESYRVDPPPQRTHEDWVKEQIARDAYMDLVDGKGDHDCGHEH